MFDAHCHLESFPNPSSTIAACLSSISGFITCGYDMKSSAANIDIAARHEGAVWAAAGMAPQVALKAEDKDVEVMLSFLRENKSEIVAVGEIGLDYKWAKTEPERERQGKAFKMQLQVARELALPVVIHSRDAEGACVQAAIDAGVERVMMHCYSGSEELALKAAQEGFYISVPPLRSKERKKVIKSVALDLLLAESDAPAIGKDPLAALESAALIAEIKGEDIGAVKAALERNCRKLFDLQ